MTLKERVQEALEYNFIPDAIVAETLSVMIALMPEVSSVQKGWHTDSTDFDHAAVQLLIDKSKAIAEACLIDKWLNHFMIGRLGEEGVQEEKRGYFGRLWAALRGVE